MIQLFIYAYWLVVAALAIYGLLGLYTFWQYWRHRHDSFPGLPLPTEPPSVTIQLPIYNEQFVVGRLIQAAINLKYPQDRLQIQVIDDSTDSTTSKAARLVAYYKRKGVNINHIQRPERYGFKAGALANALPTATGDFIAIFDADFQPNPDFLQKTIPHFLNEPQIGMIQTRWSHLNQEESPLTAAQAIALDKHFAMEQTARHRAGLFPKFNGAGGIWRRTCLEGAGGWQEDTVCEDLCLSTRALLRDWHFLFLNEVTTPAEIPASISAYKTQQARWAKGSSQCLLKYARQILGSEKHPLTARLYALLAMSAYNTHLLAIIILLFQLPLILLNYQLPSWFLLLTIAGLGQPLLFGSGQRVLYEDWLRRLRYFPMLLLLAIGMAPTNTRAIFQAIYGRHHPFIRTPKRGNSPRTSIGYQLPFDKIVIFELFCAGYALLTIFIAIHRANFGPLFFLITCFLGFSYVAGLTLHEQVKIQFALRKTQIAPHTTHH